MTARRQVGEFEAFAPGTDTLPPVARRSCSWGRERPRRAVPGSAPLGLAWEGSGGYAAAGGGASDDVPGGGLGNGSGHADRDPEDGAAAAGGDDGASDDSDDGSPWSAGTPAEELGVVLDRLLAASVDDLDETAITNELEAVERASRRLDARRCRLAAALAAQRADQAQQEADANGQDRVRARQRARRKAEEELAEQHRWSPSDAKRATGIGEQLGADDDTQAAFDDGVLPPRHAQLLADTLKLLEGDQRDQARRTLLDAAAEQDVRTFGRTCRRLLASMDAAAAMRAEDRRHQRRRASVTDTEDGMLAVSGQWSGVDGEIVATAIEAFRAPDPPGVHRTAGQRTADAVVELARAALRAAEAPTVHGVRPHVSVLLDHEAILADAEAVADGQCGAPVVVDTPWMGPLPFAEIRRLLADAGVSRLLVDPDRVPVEAGAETRNVPAGLWRSLVARDGGCIAEGCTALVGWCDVMHLHRPYSLNGQLNLDNAALGCRHHHRCFDLYGWQIDWNGKRPRMRPPPT